MDDERRTSADRLAGRQARGAAGFTLLEVMVSLAILSVSLVAILNLHSSSVRVHNHAKHLTVATLLARSKMIDIEERLLDEGLPEYTEQHQGSFDEEGYPGNLDVWVNYTMTPDNCLKIHYQAISDKDTVLNLTNHTYFNLGGHSSGNILNHKIMINAAQFTPIDHQGIPTGEIRRVAGSPHDLRKLTSIVKGLCGDDEQVSLSRGYDHNWILQEPGNLVVKAAELHEPQSGRTMSLYTTKPGLQFYTGNYLDGKLAGKQGAAYGKHSGLCLETQYFPDSMNHKQFPSPVLKKGEVYEHITVYKFSAKNI